MVPTDSLTKGSFRLLEVDNRVVLPIVENIKVLITSADVIHCWAVPSLGVKLDAVPGRLSETSFVINRSGTFFGQCSEICGVNHGFMPIVIKAIEVDLYNSWFIKKLAN
jgi:cytochrome c oxidase subunit 2